MDAYELYGLGLEEYEKGNYPAAIGYFERSNSIEEHFKTYERLYSCWLRLNDTQKAFVCIEKAYQLNSRNNKTALEYAKMLAASGYDEQALKVLSDILLRNSSFKQAAVLADTITKKS